MTSWTGIAAVLLCLLSGAAEAQPAAVATDEPPQGAFADASFDAGFRAFTGPRTEFSPFYSWDAHLGLDLTLVRAGRNPYNNFTLRLEMFPRNQPEGRFAVLVAVAPGNGLHVSPNIGGRRDGVAVGLTLRLKS